MTQLKLILARLRKPSVILSIVSQITVIWVLFDNTLDVNLITTAVTSICSILVTLGILSDPDAKSKGYGDDVYMCENCKVPTKHISINGKMVCKSCGTENQPGEQAQ